MSDSLSTSKQYLLGREFIVRTDHRALVWLFSLNESKGRIARWKFFLSIISAYNTGLVRSKTMLIHFQECVPTLGIALVNLMKLTIQNPYS